MIAKNADHILMPEQGPAQVAAVCHRAASTHVIVAGNLIIQHGL
jgi:hypothetical protein